MLIEFYLSLIFIKFLFSMKKTINRSKTKKEDKKQVKNKKEEKLHKINTFVLNNEGTYRSFIWLKILFFNKSNFIIKKSIIYI